MKATLYNRILIVLGFLGIFVSGVLTLAAFFGGNIPCGPSHGCETVASDPSSHLLIGIPNAFIGLLGYLLLTILASAREYMGFDDVNSIRASIAFSGFGFVVSVLLQLYSHFGIHAFCPWCFTSAVAMTLMFGLSIALAIDLKKVKLGEAEGARKLPRPKASYIVPVVAIICFGGLGFQAIGMQGPGATIVHTSPELIAEMEDPSSHMMNPNGKVTVVEFGDLVCPFCHRIYPQVESIIKSSNGNIRYIFHNFPLYTNPAHKDALPSAMLAEMAGEQGKFFDFVRGVYTTEPADTKGDMVTIDQVFEVCTKLGLDLGAMKNRLNMMSKNGDSSDPAFIAVKKDLALAAKLGVNSTPTFFVFTPDGVEQKATNDSILTILNSPSVKSYWSGPPAKP